MTFAGRGHFDHAAIRHEGDAGGDFADEAHFVADDQHGHALLGQEPDAVQHLAHQFRIER